MIYVALALAVGWALSVLALLRSHDRSRREASRREDMLVNQVCALVDRRWPTPVTDDDDALPRQEPDPWVGDAEQVIA